MFQIGAFFRTILFIWSRARSIYSILFIWACARSICSNVKHTFMNASFHQEMRFGPIKLVKPLNPYPTFN